MATVHWIGAGLSSGPGLVRLAGNATTCVLWNRSTANAADMVAGLDSSPEIQAFSMTGLKERVCPGDIVVSMLPGTFHFALAELALDCSAHFVSSSYIAEDMRSLDPRAQSAGLCLVNEVGLDPGIDHLMAHSLVHRYRNSAAFDPGNRLGFRSYCGGFPEVPNDFRYKFSWSPLGVLKALKSPARCIVSGAQQDSQRPWEATTSYRATLPGGMEDFEAYPNRDSLPFIEQYEFDSAWQIDEFVRGTLRLPGWTDAWADLFARIDELEGEDGARELEQISDQLWQTQRYAPGERDRVVLCVELEARQGQNRVWHESYAIDAIGNDNASAMARLVSLTVSLAVEDILAGNTTPGVSAAPDDPEVIENWFAVLGDLGESIQWRDHLASPC